jgi:hypothetical protein
MALLLRHGFEAEVPGDLEPPPLLRTSSSCGRNAPARFRIHSKPKSEASVSHLTRLSQRNGTRRADELGPDFWIVATPPGSLAQTAPFGAKRSPGVTPIGVTQAPRCRRRCGCSPAKKQARVSRIQANGRARLDDYQHVVLVDEDFRTAPANRASAAVEPRSSRAVTGHPRLCKHASSSRLVRHRTAAHERRPAVTRRTDPSLTLLLPDKRLSEIS